MYAILICFERIIPVLFSISKVNLQIFLGIIFFLTIVVIKAFVCLSLLDILKFFQVCQLFQEILS